jgi:hydroxymethylpyrimidine/phosphomethylpyrimidine kinase
LRIQIKNSGMNVKKSYPTVLSIAGSDSGGGAGIQADLKTFSSLGVYGATAITAITAQNTQGVHSQFALPPQMVYDQIIAVMEDIHPSVIKIGMLSNVQVATVVADALERYSIPIILDPVMVSSSGHRLLSVEAQEVLKERLLPMAQLVTPNIPEMEALSDMPLLTISDKYNAAKHLLSLGVQSVLLKGGHEEGEVKVDILYQKSPQGIVICSFSSDTLNTRNIHGTGCTLSSAIAAYMARGLDLKDAVSSAKIYITEAIKAGSDISVGKGYGPVNHLFNPLKMMINEE